MSLIGYEDSSSASDPDVLLDGSGDSVDEIELFDDDVLLTDIDIGRELGSGVQDDAVISAVTPSRGDDRAESCCDTKPCQSDVEPRHR